MIKSYRLRLRRKYWRARSFRKSFELHSVVDRTAGIVSADLLLFSTMRNERVRLPYFLKYYRAMGLQHFLIVDNDSSDGTKEYLEKQEDVSLWTTKGSYKRSRFGVDWLNHLQSKYGHDHWILTVDPDEFLVFPFCDTRPLRALTDWLQASDIRSFGAMLLDMYPKGPIDQAIYRAGQDPLEVSPWFDSGNYTIARNPFYENLWIQGGPRARTFFADKPKQAPALNKIPLVKWKKHYAYVSSTHFLLPRGLNVVYEQDGGELPSGVLLHTKFLDIFTGKVEEELERAQHYGSSVEYRAYSERSESTETLWTDASVKYRNWQQLDDLGLMSKGGWL